MYFTRSLKKLKQICLSKDSLKRSKVMIFRSPANLIRGFRPVFKDFELKFFHKLRSNRCSKCSFSYLKLIYRKSCIKPPLYQALPSIKRPALISPSPLTRNFKYATLSINSINPPPPLISRFRDYQQFSIYSAKRACMLL